MTPNDLAKRWNIDLETAKRTLLKAIQEGLRTSPSPLLSQWYCTNDRMLRYRRLPVDLFTDTLEAGIVVRRRHSNPCGHMDRLVMFACSSDSSDGHSS